LNTVLATKSALKASAQLPCIGSLSHSSQACWLCVLRASRGRFLLTWLLCVLQRLQSCPCFVHNGFSLSNSMQSVNMTSFCVSSSVCIRSACLRDVAQNSLHSVWQYGLCFVLQEHGSEAGASSTEQELLRMWEALQRERSDVTSACRSPALAPEAQLQGAEELQELHGADNSLYGGRGAADSNLFDSRAGDLTGGIRGADKVVFAGRGGAALQLLEDNAAVRAAKNSFLQHFSRGTSDGLPHSCIQGRSAEHAHRSPTGAQLPQLLPHGVLLQRLWHTAPLTGPQAPVRGA
jgi:hypothetical protein